MTARPKSDVPKIFRITIEVSNIDEAAAFYAKLLGHDGKKGGLTPTPGPKSLYFAVNDLDAVHKRAKALKALASYKEHGEPAGEALKRPWGERSFYVTDPWGNDLSFVEEGTLYT